MAKHALTNIDAKKMLGDCSACDGRVHLAQYERKATESEFPRWQGFDLGPPSFHCSGKTVRQRTGRYAVAVNLPKISPGDLRAVTDFFEGEGCIHGAQRQLFLSLSSTNPYKLLWLKKMVGGSVIRETRDLRPNHRRQWQWKMTAGRNVLALLTLMRPHAIIKREEIDIALQWPIREQGEPMSKDDLATRQRIVKELKTAKRREHRVIDPKMLRAFNLEA
jgi:hypothetical protein